MTDDQKPEELTEEEAKGEEEIATGEEAEEEETEEERPSGDMSSRIAAWALNEIAEDAENSRGSGDEALRAVAAYQSSIALHKIAGALDDIQSVLSVIATKL